MPQTADMREQRSHNDLETVPPPTTQTLQALYNKTRPHLVPPPNSLGQSRGRAQYLLCRLYLQPLVYRSHLYILVSSCHLVWQ